MKFPKILSSLALAALSFNVAVAQQPPVVSLPAVSSAEQSKPNILFIFGDDLGYGDLSCYGATKLSTPNIDRLANNGIRFTNAYTTSATCSQSRVSLLTGRYWWRSELHPPRGVVGPSSPNVLLEAGVESLPKFLQANGYRTAAFGKWHLGVGHGDSYQDRYDWNRPEIEGGPLDVGFDYFFGMAANVSNEPAFYIENRNFVGREPGDIITIDGKKVTPWSDEVLYKEDEVAGDIARAAVNYIQSAPTDKPLFLYYAATIPHKPITPSKEFIGSSHAGLYGDFMQEFDSQVGDLIGALRDTGRLENTLIVFTSDNGAVVATSEKFAKQWHLEPMWETYAAGHRSNGVLRDGKHSVFDGGNHIPFIACWPGKIPAGQESDALMLLTDVYATFAELLDQPTPESAEDSLSFYSHWLGRAKATPREFAAAQTHSQIYSIRKGKWKLVEHDPKNPTPRKSENTNQLYDLENDPGEQNNLYNHYPEVVQQLKQLLSEVKRAPKPAKSVDNLLPEGDFDQMQGERLSPGWELKTYKKGANLGSAEVTASAEDGNRCLKFSSDGGLWSLNSRAVDAQEGLRYTLSVRVKSIGQPANATLYMISPWELVETQDVQITTEWQTYTMEVTPTKLGAERNLMVRMDLSGVGSLLIDDMKLSSKVF